MKRVLRVLAGTVLAAGILAGLLFAASWLFWPTRAQEQALALLTIPVPEPQGGNAFADVWLLRYDLTPEARERIAAADVARFNRSPATYDGTGLAEPFVSDADAGHREERLPPASDHGCGLRMSAGCLERVRSDPAKAAALLDAHAGLLQRSREALEYNDYLRSRFHMRPDMPFAIIAMGEGSALMRIDAALSFVRGERMRGLESSCRSVVAWRRWMRQPDLLIDAMMGDAAIRGWLEMQGQMLAELPADVPLPAACQSLREPPPLTNDAMCRVIKREFEFSRPALEQNGYGKAEAGGASGWRMRFVYRPHATKAMIAETMAWPCSEEARRQRLADRPVIVPLPQAGLRIECVANAVGCILNDIDRPTMAPYQHRLQDQRARLNLMATLLWLREQPRDNRSLTARVQARPAALKRGREVQVVEGRLRIALFDQRDGAYWELAVPAELH
ncbi:hypothetical protein [Pseudoxanthomonas sp. z9]|uniref:hypothetical protein n=1 Tax=Pseudoxanthomonas sp. z9 TaxID=2584942 RepID=UPI001144F3DD|nr:hypothetical protein [Pseudoxanthomonas sp. z9]